jgi:hypothetical protein
MLVTVAIYRCVVLYPDEDGRPSFDLVPGWPSLSWCSCRGVLKRRGFYQALSRDVSAAYDSDLQATRAVLQLNSFSVFDAARDHPSYWYMYQD